MSDSASGARSRVPGLEAARMVVVYARGGLLSIKKLGILITFFTSRQVNVTKEHTNALSLASAVT